MCAEWEIKDIIRKEMSKKIDEIDKGREKIDTILNKIKFNQKEDSIISFNYDTLIEQTLGLEKCYYPGLNKKTKTQYIPILKPHGSLNWLSNGGRVSPKDIAYIEESDLGVTDNKVKDIWIAGLMECKENTVLTAFNAEIYNKIEKEMKELLEKADKIIILGYSLQRNDKHIRKAYHRAKEARKHYLKELTWVVNEDKEKESEYIEKARQHFLITEDIKPELGGIDAWLKTP